jgi:hypothetical protein
MFGITADEAPPLKNSILHSNLNTLKATTRDGKPARIAIIDEDGNILDVGQHVADAVRIVTVASYNNFLRGKGHLVSRNPEELRFKG